MKTQKNQKIELSPRAKLIGKYNAARANLLAMILITIFNVIIALFGDGTYYLFTAFVPYYVVFDGMFCCGKLSPEWYGGDISEFAFFDISYLVTMVAFALVILALYFVFWLLSKNRKVGWMVAALVLFGIDTVGLLYFYGFYLDVILDILFHAWILYYLISGVVAAKKLKDMPADEEEQEPEGLVAETVRLQNGKEASSIPANYFFGQGSVWKKQYENGALYLYADRVIFKAHEDATVPLRLELCYADMSGTKPQKNLGIPNGILVEMADGSTYKFNMNKKQRDDVMNVIDRKILAFRNQG